MIAQPFNQPPNNSQPSSHRESPERRLADSSLISIHVKSEQSSSSPFKSSSQNERVQYSLATVDQVDDLFLQHPQKAQHLQFLKDKHKFYDITPEVEIADPVLEEKLERLLLEIMDMEEAVKKEEDELFEIKVKKAVLEGERQSLRHLAEIKNKSTTEAQKEFEQAKVKFKAEISTKDLVMSQKNLFNTVSMKTQQEVRQVKGFLEKQLEIAGKELEEAENKVKKLDEQYNRQVSIQQMKKKVRDNPQITELQSLIENYQRQLKRLHQAIEKRQQLTFI